MCQVIFPPLSSRRKASAIGLLCKLLDGQCRGPLQNFCPLLTSVTHTYHLRHVTDDPLSLQGLLTRFDSLDIFIRSFNLGLPPIDITSKRCRRRMDYCSSHVTETFYCLMLHTVNVKCIKKLVLPRYRKILSYIIKFYIMLLAYITI